MKPTSEILERIEKCSRQHQNGVFIKLFRYLLREDIYEAAYQTLFANREGATKGNDNDTEEELRKRYIKSFIQQLKEESYKAKPARREPISKKHGNLCLHVTPSFGDQLLQEVVRMILEAIYEPIFDSHSHGFRPNKSCHTALRQISSDFTGVVWLIKGDMGGYFDNRKHEKLIDILGGKIKDSRFLNVIRQFLKAGYIGDWNENATDSDSMQGSICSPILFNIYLNALDKKVEEIKHRFHKLKTASQTPPANHKKLTFVRYADKWLVGVSGTKQECEALKEEITAFLSVTLNIDGERMKITHSSEKVRFLGYDICVRRSQEIRSQERTNGTRIKSQSLHRKVVLTIPHAEKIEKFLFAKGIIRQRENGEFQPIHRAELLYKMDSEIVEQYNAEIRELCSYYNLACDYHTLDYFCYHMEYSCLKTIAAKHKTSIRKIRRQYKDAKTWSVPFETKAGTRRVRIVKIVDCKRGKTIVRH